MPKSMGNTTYDVIIVGAGPAGCMTAILLSDVFNVLIIERQKLPRSKSCSGILIEKSVKLIREYVGEIPEYVQCIPRKTTGLSVTTSSDTFDFSDNGLNIIRAEFDYWLTKEAQKKEAEVIEEANISGIRRGKNITVEVYQGQDVRELETKLLIACDGINGCSRRLLGVVKQKKVITYQKFYKGTIDMDATKFYAYTSPEFSKYDAWINSKDGMLVIGVIAEKKTEAQHYHEKFIEFLIKTKNLRISREVDEEIWFLPLVVPEPDLVFNNDNIFFAGEAAGLLNPFGEGISLALSSAIALAGSCKMHKHKLSQYDSIADGYKNLMSKELAYMKRQWDFLMRFAPEFQHNIKNLRGI